MARKNIFESIKENYNIDKEIEKIYDNLQKYHMFCKFKIDKITKEELHIANYKFYDFCNIYLFDYLPEKGTCRNIEEIIEYADAELIFGKNSNLTKDRIINFIEVIENFFYIYFKKYRYLKRKYRVNFYIDSYEETRFLLDELEKRMGLSKIGYEDRIIVFFDNPKLNQAISNIEKPELALELIKYKKEATTSIEKRMILKQLDILTEPITDRIKNKYNPAKDLDCILNNFQLRHNNIDVESNDYHEKVAKLSEEELCKIYDITYELILDTLMLNDYDKKIADNVKTFKSYLK